MRGDAEFVMGASISNLSKLQILNAGHTFFTVKKLLPEFSNPFVAHNIGQSLKK